jgi:hypothetical protein
MVQSSIVIPSAISASSSSRKRSIDSANPVDTDMNPDEEVKLVPYLLNIFYVY